MHRLRWIAIATLLPAVIAIHAAIVAILVAPFDPAELAATSEPLAIVDRHGEPIATLAAEDAGSASASPSSPTAASARPA